MLDGVSVAALLQEALMATLSFRRSRTVAATVLGGLLLGSLVGAPAQAQPRPDLTVMTRNIYLGSSLAPATGIDPSDPNAGTAFVAAVAEIYGTMLFTDFPTRAGALADEIAANEPDLIGLQEVSDWTAVPVGAPSATPPSLDFLEILLATLDSRGLNYSVAGVSENAEIGPLPLISPPFGCNTITPIPGGLLPDCVVTFADRDVILVNDDTEGLRVGPARSGQYAAQAVLPTPAGPLSFDRGWVAVDGRYAGKLFRFVNTHLETEDFPSVQQAQAAEFLTGPARGGAVVAVGDFNSASDGSTTTSYAQLTAPPAFADAWSAVGVGDGLSCCQNSTLTNPVTEVATRIDLVLTRGPVRAVSADLVGDEPFRAQTMPPRPVWASDHAGVVADVRLR
jgi:endonuclease/exonuclease/phosphatase family metal-dependent hydrolase